MPSQSKQTNYDKCKQSVINKVLKSYEKEKKETKSKQQQIAIALHIAEKECKPRTAGDINKLKKKAKEFLHNEQYIMEERKSKEMSQSRVNEIIQLINKSRKGNKGQKSYATKLKQDLQHRVLNAITHKVKVHPEIRKSLNKL